MIANSFCPSNISHLLVRGLWKSPLMEFGLIDRSSCTVSLGINFSTSINYNNFFMSKWILFADSIPELSDKNSKANRERTLPISALKILLLVNSFIQISVDVNKPIAIKCCAMTQMQALLYIYWLLMTNTLFVEQISCQINFFVGTWKWMKIAERNSTIKLMNFSPTCCQKP